MANIGVIPMKTCVEISSSTGDNGTISGATPSGAGVMTAEHAKMLEELWKFHRMKSEGGALVINASPQIDTAQFPTRIELQQALASMPRPVDSAPALNALRTQLADMQRKLLDLNRPAEQPSVVVHNEQTDVVDIVARNVIEGFIDGMQDFENRLSSIEAKFETLRQVAAVKAETEDAA